MAYETPERQLTLTLLRMATLASTVVDRPFDDDLQDLIRRAKEGDESVDLKDVLERVSAHLPNPSSADPTTWTFDEGLRASCEYFSIAIPDGYRVLTDCEEGFIAKPRPFIAVPNEVDDKDISTADRLVCGAMDIPVPDIIEEHGIDEVAIMAMRASVNKGGPFSSKIPVDWVVQGRNCNVLIARMDNGCTGYEYWIRPAIPQMGYYVRCVFSNCDASQAEEARDALTAMAQSVEATPPIESELTRQLESMTTSKVEPEEFCEAAGHLFYVLDICRDQCYEANLCQYFANTEDGSEYGFARAVVLGLEAYVERTFPLYASLVDALDFQKSQGAGKDELAQEAEAVEPIADQLLLKFDANDQGGADFLAEHGPIALPEGYWDLIERLDAYRPGTMQATQHKVENRDRELQESLEKFGLGESAATRNEPDADAYDEPDGVDYPTLMMTLLSDDWIFFMDEEITWDGHHHAIAGVQLDDAKADGFLDFVNSCVPGFDDVNEVFQYFAAILNEIEKDEGLIVPRNMIAPGVQRAIRTGDLTGLTLANLAACNKAFCVQKVEPGVYRTIFDGRLIKGIPCFLDLVARLLWDMRQCTNSMRGKPFEISFLQARNIDADQYLGSVDTPVPGAQGYAMCMKVTKAPSIMLPDASKSSAYQEQASIELSPGDDMALGFVYALVRDFPCTKPISGTHHMGRAERIERVNVGDKLILAADWNCEFFDPAGIEVFNEQGETLGYLEGVIGPNRGALALLLPHITATAASVTPLSARRKGAKYALMDVRLELDDDATVEGTLNVDPSDELLAEARRLAYLPKPERTVMSHASIPISQLKGHIDVGGYAADQRAALHDQKAILQHQKELDESSDEIKGTLRKFHEGLERMERGKQELESDWKRAKQAIREAKAAQIDYDQALELSQNSNANVRAYALKHDLTPAAFKKKLADAKRAASLAISLRALLRGLSITRASSRHLLELATEYSDDDLKYLDIDLSDAKECAMYLDADMARSIVEQGYNPVMGATAEIEIRRWLELKRDLSAPTSLDLELGRCKTGLDKLLAEQSGLGLFAFDRKKSIVMEIAVLQARIDALKKAIGHEASLQTQDLNAFEKAAVDALKQELGDAASELTSIDEFLMHPDLA